MELTFHFFILSLSLVVHSKMEPKLLLFINYHLHLDHFLLIGSGSTIFCTHNIYVIYKNLLCPLVFITPSLPCFSKHRVSFHLIKIATNERIEHTYKIYAILAFYWVDYKVVANVVKYKTQTKYIFFS